MPDLSNMEYELAGLAKAHVFALGMWLKPSNWADEDYRAETEAAYNALGLDYYMAVAHFASNPAITLDQARYLAADDLMQHITALYQRMNAMGGRDPRITEPDLDEGDLTA